MRKLGSIKMEQKTDSAQHEASGEEDSLSKLCVAKWKNKAALCDSLSTAVTGCCSTTGEHKENSKATPSPATNQPFVSQRQEVVRNTAENKHNHFPHLYPGRRTAGGAFSRQLEQGELEPRKTSALSALKKQLGQRRTFVLAGKTTRDRLTEEKSSCVQQREDGEGGSDPSVLSSLLMRLISVTGQETGDGGLG